jgi:hypothetical protein
LAEDDNIGLLAELWFYRYAHYDKWFEIAEKKLTEYIAKGATSVGWNLQDHVEIAKKNKTSDIDKLERFAKLITQQA